MARRFEPSAGALRDDQKRPVFDVGELTRQQISLPGAEFRQPPSVKDIETINLFTRTAEGRISAVQLTSTWLVAVEGMAALKAQAAEGRAVDVRSYSVEYERTSGGEE